MLGGKLANLSCALPAGAVTIERWAERDSYHASAMIYYDLGVRSDADRGDPDYNAVIRLDSTLHLAKTGERGRSMTVSVSKQHFDVLHRVKCHIAALERR
jgi:hypothetical protein